ncbi:MBL fold metallo-hydrolase [Paenibacillus sp. SYP-B4298]|uniref:MBL fold metallo-hydrolase n=1 Tax=Paenibacillus sp. SYP-B4298 TaxID=2996034 RepID=UPI0022DDD71B|nr:MBL fold metallo-hydrolase [Paenibacillus sp. SYP-B4298]
MITRLPVKLTLRSAGSCLHPEALTLRGGTLRPVEFPAGYACIEHPLHGMILFDTGYSSRFFAETARLPASLYRHITPVRYEDRQGAASQLLAAGIEPEQVQYVVLSHFHADHIGGVRDFPQAQFIYASAAYEAVRQLRGLRAVRAGFLPGLLPDDFARRSLPFSDGEAVECFDADFPLQRGWDLLGDGSLLAVMLPGHAAGMIGLFVSDTQHDYLLCADAVWSSRAYREQRLPHPLAGLIMSSRRDYQRSFALLTELHQRYPRLRIVPSHCREALAAWGSEQSE